MPGQVWTYELDGRIPAGMFVSHYALQLDGAGGRGVCTAS